MKLLIFFFSVSWALLNASTGELIIKLTSEPPEKISEIQFSPGMLFYVLMSLCSTGCKLLSWYLSCEGWHLNNCIHIHILIGFFCQPIRSKVKATLYTCHLYPRPTSRAHSDWTPLAKEFILVYEAYSWKCYPRSLEGGILKHHFRVSDGNHVAVGCHDNDVYIYELLSEGRSVSLKVRCKVTDTLLTISQKSQNFSGLVFLLF